MNSRQLYSNYYAACVYYVKLNSSTSSYPTSADFVQLRSDDAQTVYITQWNQTDPATAPSSATLQSYTVAQVQDALFHFNANMGFVDILIENYPIAVQDISGTTPLKLVNINNVDDFAPITLLSISALSFLEASDNLGYTIYIYDSTRNITIASDHFSNTINGWNSLTLLNQLPQGSDVIVDVYAFCNTSITTAYVDNIAINYYYT